MPYALFDDEVKLSKAYPTEAEVWKHASENGLVVDRVSDEENARPQPVLDKGYTIKSCQCDPDESPEKNQRDAEHEARQQPYLKS